MDLEELRVALRRMSRDKLLIIAEPAIGLVRRPKLRVLVGAKGARKFHDASLRGEHYESFNVNSKNYMDQSRGTAGFIAEFNRLLGTWGTCIRVAAKGPRVLVRDAFEFLLELLRRIDEDPDDPDSIVFFADEGGAWQVGVDWSAREVDRAIEDLADYERPKHMTAARRVANAEQKAALSRLSRARRGRSDSRRA